MWTSYRGGPTRTGSLAGVNPARDPSSETAWTVQLAGGTVLPDMIRVAAGRVYVGRSDGLSVLNAATGQQRWRYTDHAPEAGLTILPDSSPAVPDGVCDGADAVVFLVHSDGVVQLRDDGDRGQVVRTTDATVDTSASSVLCHPPDSRYIYAVLGSEKTDDRRVEVLPISDRSVGVSLRAPRISNSVYTPLSAGRVDSTAGENETRVYVPTGDEWFPRSVSVIKTRSVVGQLTEMGDLDPPIVPNGQILFGRYRDAISTLPFEGQDLFRCDLSQGLDTPDWSSGYCVADHAPVVTTDRLVSTCRRGETITAVDHDGFDQWTVDLDGGRTDQPDPIAVGDVVYVVAGDSLFAFDHRGNELFDYAPDAPITALAGADPGLYVGTKSAVHALTDVDGTRVFAPSPSTCPDCESNLDKYDAPDFCPECGHSL